MLIDFHTHAFPDRIAKNAIEKLAFCAGGLYPQTDGTLSSLKEQMNVDGVDISVVQSIATNPGQQTKVNNFADTGNTLTIHNIKFSLFKGR